jgi:hypothetical protein
MEQQPVTGKTVVRRSEEEILKHLGDQEQSGLSVKEYCEMFELVEPTFYSWMKKYRSKPEEEVKGFAMVEVVPAVILGRPQLFAEVGSIRLYKEVSAEYLKSLLP